MEFSQLKLSIVDFENIVRKKGLGHALTSNSQKELADYAQYKNILMKRVVANNQFTGREILANLLAYNADYENLNYYK
ncbi:hypothetical protein [Sulfurimonas sp. ST-27]|uniref:hypothetical protein n=1 Tax=Sulfurimonas sp. ST-27 TaxID=3400152 RepID=UPI003AB69A58